MLSYFKKQPAYRWVFLVGLLLIYPALTTLVYLTRDTTWFSLAVLLPAVTFLSVGPSAGNGLLVFTLLLFGVLGMREGELGVRSAMLFHIPVALLVWIFALIHRFRANEEERVHQRTMSTLEERLALIREQYKTDLVVNVSNQKKSQKYSLLNRVSRIFGSQLQLDKLADKVIQEVLSVVGAERGRYQVSFSFQDSPGSCVRSLPEIEAEEVRREDQYSNYVAQHRTSLLVSDTNDDFRFQALGSEAMVRSLMLSPMLSAGHPIGLLRAESPFPDIFSKDDLRLFTIISDLACVAAENAHLYQCAQELAITDGLTGLYLRRFFNQRFEEELERYREHSTPFSLIILDLDHFKRINDRQGHLAGDQVLAQLGEALRAEARVADLLCRFGGEEFALILPNTNLEGALVMAERIRSRIAQREFYANQETLKLTVSLGIGECPKNGQDMIELIRITDEALYMAKRRGRNRIILAGSRE